MKNTRKKSERPSVNKPLPEITLPELYKIFEKQGTDFETKLEEMRTSYWLPVGDVQLWHLHAAARSIARALAIHCCTESARMKKNEENESAKRKQRSKDKEANEPVRSDDFVRPESTSAKAGRKTVRKVRGAKGVGKGSLRAKLFGRGK